MLKILIAESRTLVQEHLRRLLSGQSSLKVIAAVHGGHALIEALRLENSVELVIAGWYNSEPESLDWLREAKLIKPRLPIIIISNITGADFVKEVFLLGVSGYFLSNVGPEEFLFGINHVALGGEYISAGLAIRIIVGPPVIKGNSGRGSFREYSAEDIRLLQAIADGYSNAQIAEMFFLSRRSIESRRAVLLRKTGMDNTASMVKFAALNGLVE